MPVLRFPFEVFQKLLSIDRSSMRSSFPCGPSVRQAGTPAGHENDRLPVRVPFMSAETEWANKLANFLALCDKG
jgi:hypothetical protein